MFETPDLSTKVSASALDGIRNLNHSADCNLISSMSAYLLPLALFNKFAYLFQLALERPGSAPLLRAPNWVYDKHQHNYINPYRSRSVWMCDKCKM